MPMYSHEIALITSSNNRNSVQRRAGATRYNRLNLRDWSDKKCKSMTRFTYA